MKTMTWIAETTQNAVTSVARIAKTSQNAATFTTRDAKTSQNVMKTTTQTAAIIAIRDENDDPDC